MWWSIPIAIFVVAIFVVVPMIMECKAENEQLKKADKKGGQNGEKFI